MEEKNKIEQIIANVKEYVETQYDLILINVQDKVSDILSSIASVMVLGVLAVFVLLFTSIGVAWALGQAWNNPAMGFFCVSGFYLLVSVIIIINKDKWIKTPIIKSLLRQINIHEKD